MTPVSTEVMQEAFGDFTVTCKCGSQRVEWENDLGYSELSGPWGHAGFYCHDCKTTTSMIEG